LSVSSSVKKSTSATFERYGSTELSSANDPASDLRLCVPIRRPELARAFREVEHDRAGLENRRTTGLPQHGNLPEGLLGQVRVARLDGRVDQVDRVVPADLVQHPAHTMVAHLSRREGWHPFEGGHCDHVLLQHLAVFIGSVPWLSL
jgi:hypothetical protein